MAVNLDSDLITKLAEVANVNILRGEEISSFPGGSYVVGFEGAAGSAMTKRNMVRYAAKKLDGPRPYEGIVHEWASSQDVAVPITSPLVACQEVDGDGEFWMVTLRGDPVSLPGSESDLAPFFDVLHQTHQLDSIDLLKKLPGRFGRMGRKQTLRQLTKNLAVVDASSRVQLEEGTPQVVTSARALLEEIVDWRFRAEDTFVHGDAIIDNWKLVDGNPVLIDWEIARLDDALIDYQAFLMPLPIEQAVDLVARSWRQETSEQSLMMRFLAARADYCIRVAAWFSILEETHLDAARSSPARFSGDVSARAERCLKLVNQALQKLEAALDTWGRYK